MSALVDRLLPVLLVAPIVLPMATAALMLLLGEGRKPLKTAMGLGSSMLSLVASVALLGPVEAQGTVVSLMGNWPAPFGIVVVADRLTVLMLALTWVIGLCVTLFASARWDKAGVYFHPLLQLQLMGISGAFLTGDLFNLFVFFEILLAASFGLLLHGSGRPRVSAGLHYVVVNLCASSLFLLGAALLYGVTGTLNMADLSHKVDTVAAADAGLLHVGAGFLGMAFLVKAALWPLNFWLVPAYRAATAPVAGIFALLTKVGVYAIFRMQTLLFSEGPWAGYGDQVLLFLGLLTVVLGALGMVGSQLPNHLAGFTVMISSGTLLAALGLDSPGVTGGALYYLLGSTLVISALFLLIDLVERWRNSGQTLPDEAPFLTHTLQEEREVNLDDDEEMLVGQVLPASTALLALLFMVCALLVAGLPPLSTFVGKFAMLGAALAESGSGEGVPLRVWAFLVVVIGAGLLSLLAMMRLGILHFWAEDREPPHVRLAEAIPVVALLTATLGLTLWAGPILQFTREAGAALHHPRGYVEAVLGARVVPAPTQEQAPSDAMPPTRPEPAQPAAVTPGSVPAIAGGRP